MTTININGAQIEVPNLPSNIEILYCASCGLPVGGVDVNFFDAPIVYCPDCLVEMEGTEEDC